MSDVTQPTKKEDVPLGMELNESGYHVTRIIRCLNKSTDADAEKAAADLVAMTRDLIARKQRERERELERADKYDKIKELFKGDVK